LISAGQEFKNKLKKNEEMKKGKRKRERERTE
jgi:hypothetical protein